MKTRENNARALSWLPALIGMAVIFYASSLPGREINLPPFPFSDKVVHFAVYGMLGALIAWRMPLRTRLGGSSPAMNGKPDWFGAAVGMAYGVGDEIHQIFVPMRMFEFADMAADSLGVAAGLWAFRRFTRRPGGA